MLIRSFLVAAAIAVGAAANVAAQDPAGAHLCASTACRLWVDWGSTGAPNQVDRRYGALGEYQRFVIEQLGALGVTVRPGQSEEIMTFRLRPQLVNALCDVMPGTNPDNSCRAVGEVIIDISNTDPALKLPANIRIRNRCGSDQRMDMTRFSEYTAAMIIYEMTRDQKPKRPSTKC